MKETLQLDFNPLGGETLVFQRRPPIAMGPERVLYVRTRKRLASRLGLNSLRLVDFLSEAEDGPAPEASPGPEGTLQLRRALELTRSRDEAAARLCLFEGPASGNDSSFEERILSA